MNNIPNNIQMDLEFKGYENNFKDKIKEIDINNLTPVEAIKELDRIIKLIRKN